MSEFVSWMNSTGESFVAFAVHMLVQSSVLILILLLLDLVLRKKIRAVVRYWIWMLVLAKLLLPPSLSSPTSLAWWFADKLPQTLPAVVDAPAEPKQEVLLSPPLPEVSHRDVLATQPAIDPAASSAATTPARVDPVAAPAPIAPTWQALLLAGWLVVVAVMLALLMQRALFVRRLVAQSQTASEPLLDLLDRCRRQMRVRTPVRLRVTSVSASPSVCGLVRPTILIPQGMLAHLDGGQWKSILLHELAHVRRADLWVNLAQTLLQIAYVYNPLLWLANATIRKVREQAVDETVLAAMGDEAEEYPRTLLNISKLAFGRPSLTLRLIGVVESKRTLIARIKHIVSRPFPTTARLGMAGVVLVLTVGATLLPMAKAKHDAEAVVESATAVLPAAASAEPGQALVQKAAAPAGVVVDEKGAPISDARVLLYHRRSTWGLNNRVVEETRTNAQGRFVLAEPLAYKNSNGTTYTDHFLLFATHPDRAMAWQVIVAGQEQPEYRLTVTEPTTQAFRVTDREGNPLANARVWISGAGLNDEANPLLRPYVDIPEDLGLLTAITDGQGRTTLGNLPRTHCSFRASLPGYSNRYAGVDMPPQGETHIEMTRAATVTGRVLTADGKPVVGAEVWFQADWGEWYFDYAVTDETGTFLNDKMVARGGSWVENGGSGQYKVTVRHPQFIAPETVVQLEPGQTDAFDIEAVPGTLLRIHVLEPETERPIAGARIYGSSAGGRLDGYTDANGVFERQVLNGEANAFFGSPPGGTYVLQNNTASRSTQITAEGGVKEVTLYAPSRLHPLVGIRGRLTLPDGSPAGGIKISTTNHASGYDTATFGGTGGAYTRTNPDGTFDLKEVPRDMEVFLYAQTSDRKYVLAEVLDPAQASPELDLPLVMREGARTSVVVTDKSGKPQANMALRIRPRKWDHHLFRADDRTVTTDAEGRLTLDGIVPGLEYFIRDAKANLSERGWRDLYNENRVLLPLDGGPAVLTLPAPQGDGVISGAVVDPNGKPIAGAYVSLENTDLLLLPKPQKFGSQMRKVMRANGVQTDLQGQFRIADLNPGVTEIRVSAPRYRTEWIPNVAAGTEGLRIVLGEPRPYQLSGVVVDEASRGIEAVEVAFVEEATPGRAPEEGNTTTTLRTDRTGAFRLDRTLPPVDWATARRSLFARKEGYAVWGCDLDDTGGQPFIRITLRPPETVSGAVIDEAGKPIAGVLVALRSCWGQRDIFSFSPTSQPLAPQATTDARGVFTLGQLPNESDLFLQVRAEGYAASRMPSVRTGRFGSYAIERDGGFIIQGNSEDPNAPLVITLQKAVTLRGTVVYEDTGRPAEAVSVLVQSVRLGSGDETITDSVGRFELKSLSPAPCNLMVVERSQDRVTTPKWTAAAIHFDNLQPGETRDGLQLVLTKGTVVRGRVTDAQGHPLRGIDIAFYSAARPQSGAACQSILTAADGTWAYPFPPGPVHVYIRTKIPGGRWRQETYDYNVTAGKTIENVDFVLNREVPESSPHRAGSAGL